MPYAVPLDAVMVLSYCVAASDPRRLTKMGDECFHRAMERFVWFHPRFLIITSAHETAEVEEAAKIAKLERSAITMQKVLKLKPVTDTYDEAEKVSELCKRHDIRSLLLVAEERHMPRAFRIFERALPGVDLYNSSVFSGYEEEYYAEPPSIRRTLKQWRSRYMPLRLLVEWLLDLALPLILWRRRKTKGVG